MLPDLHTPAPSRTDINPDTVVTADLVDALKRLVARWKEVQDSGDPRLIVNVIEACTDGRELWSLMRQRLQGIKHEMNAQKLRESAEMKKGIAREIAIRKIDITTDYYKQKRQKEHENWLKAQEEKRAKREAWALRHKLATETWERQWKLQGGPPQH
jgi:hypothetical protein